jgi:hypothetical protein
MISVKRIKFPLAFSLKGEVEEKEEIESPI